MILSSKTIYLIAVMSWNTWFILLTFEQMSENLADGTVETPIDWEARAKKAEAKIVADKQSKKETTPEVITPEVKTEDTSNFMTRADFEKDKFFESNPNLVDHKESINELVSKWYSLDDAKTVTLAKDTTIASRQNTQNSNFTAWAADFSKATYTTDELTNLPQNEYNKVIELSKQGKVQFT